MKNTHAHHPDVFAKDYTAPAFMVPNIELDIDIQPKHVTVTNRMTVIRNPKARDKKAPLRLVGVAQKLLGVAVDGKLLDSKGYTRDGDAILIPGIAGKAVVTVSSTNDPYNNTALFGLYKAGPMLCTQCEPEGFRRITYHPDRPDVMGKFRVTLHADKKTYPVLLSNGNLMQKGSEGKGRHYAVWEDPFPKPSYLFAAVAGKLDVAQSRYKTKSGRNVLLEVYTEPGQRNKTGVAMQAIKDSMKWDEKTFGLEYDLDRFMLVATPFFNMGAMENKGLNIFNDLRALGVPETMTDFMLGEIERVVGHEYFHNWSGNRVTCRDWFQITLKEGLTVFREQEFCADMHSRPVERIDTVRDLRRTQFPEDAGAMAHPIRPPSYQEVDNFYTKTLYEKGSEVIRMIQTLTGVKGFRKGLALYFKRHDGTAATCDDFVKAMEDANKINLSQFMLWYSQAGTPRLDVKGTYDAKKKTYTLDVKQSSLPSPGQKTKKPYHMPLLVGLLDSRGRDMVGTQLLNVKKPREAFVFKNIKEKPVPSLLRDFSAPVNLTYPYTDNELLFLLAHDSDAFNRWEAGRTLATRILLARAGGKKADAGDLIAAWQEILHDKRIDNAFRYTLLVLPNETELGIAQQARGQKITPDELAKARDGLLDEIVRVLQFDFAKVYKAHEKIKPLATDAASVDRRALKNLCLHYLVAAGDKTAAQTALKLVTHAKGMTDQVAGLGALIDTDLPQRKQAIDAFAKKWRGHPTTMDGWLSAQALSRRSDTLQQVKKLVSHWAFDIKNPNRVRSLLRAFITNPNAFHAKDGSGYRFIADMLLKVDKINPHAASYLAQAFTTWRDYDAGRQKLLKAELQRMAKQKLSVNCAEIIQKSLKA